jgi:hypothetical protein
MKKKKDTPKEPLVYSPEFCASLARAYQSVISKELIFGSFIINPNKEDEEKSYEMIDIRNEITRIFAQVLAAHKVLIKTETLKTNVRNVSTIERDIYTTFDLTDGTSCEFITSEDWLGQCSTVMVSVSGNGKGIARYYENYKTAEERIQAEVTLAVDFMKMADVFNWQLDV